MDRASNIQGKFRSLKTLIMKEKPCAFDIHYFAPQLQSAFIILSKKDIHIAFFFNLVNDVVNIIGELHLNVMIFSRYTSC